jgi:YcaO-like protein with predicted kinase domain
MAQHKHVALQALLESIHPHFRVQELELPELPVFLAVAIPRDDTTTGRRPRLPAGRGLNASQACASAAGESIELMASLAQSCDRQRNAFESRDGMVHVLAHGLGSNEDRFFSAQTVYLDWAHVFSEDLQHEADSNGCAAGATLDEAVNKGLFECIERDAMAIWWYARQSRSHFPSAYLDAIAPRLSWWLSNRKRKYHLIDVSSEVKAPVIAAVSHNEDGKEIAIGSASAPDTKQAVISAVTEMVQMEVSMQIGNENEELRNWQQRSSFFDMSQFTPNTKMPVRMHAGVDPQAATAGAGHKMFAVNLTRQTDKLAAARVVVPTFSALHRNPDAERIVAQSRLRPEFAGVRHISDFETFAPY